MLHRLSMAEHSYYLSTVVVDIGRKQVQVILTTQQFPGQTPSQNKQTQGVNAHGKAMVYSFLWALPEHRVQADLQVLSAIVI